MEESFAHIAQLLLVTNCVSNLHVFYFPLFTFGLEISVKAFLYLPPFKCPDFDTYVLLYLTCGSIYFSGGLQEMMDLSRGQICSYEQKKQSPEWVRGRGRGPREVAHVPTAAWAF